MKWFLPILCSILLVNSPNCISQNESVNFFAFTKKSIEKAIADFTSQRDSLSSVTFTTSQNEFDAFLEPIVAQILQENGINFLGKMPINNVMHLRMQIEDFSIEFNTTSHSKDSLVEKGKCIARIVGSRNEMNPFVSSISTSYTTVVHRTQAKKMWSNLPSIVKTEMPNEPSSMIDDILTPVLFVGTAVITLLLLFTVRTQ